MTNPDNITITTFYLDMASDQCGYPVCCPGNQPKFVEVSFFPSQVSEIEDDLRKLFEDAKEVFHETGMPMFPCLLHHFCLPFSPICAMFYCMSQRKSRLDELIQSFNHGIANPKGILICWNSDYYAMNQNSGRRRGFVIPLLKPGLEVQFNIPKRQEYCAKYGLNFDWAPPGVEQPPPYFQTSQNLQAFPMDQSGFPPGYSGGFTTGYGAVATAPPEYSEENKNYYISHGNNDSNGVQQID